MPVMPEARVIPFWQFLAGWLHDHQWTQTQLADELGVHQTVVSKWLHPDIRRRARPGREATARLSEVLGTPLDELVPMLVLDQRAAAQARVDTRATQVAPDSSSDAPPPAIDATDAKIRSRLRDFESIVASYPKALRVAVIEANIKLAQLFKDTNARMAEIDASIQAPTNAPLATDTKSAGPPLEGDQPTPRGPLSPRYALPGRLAIAL